MVVVLCALLSIDIALSALHLEYDDHGFLDTTWSIKRISVVDFSEL